MKKRHSGMEEPEDESIARFRELGQLLFHPELRPYRHASAATLSLVAYDALRGRCRALLRHCWALLEETYGIVRGRPFVVVYHTNKFCILTVTPDVGAAVRVAAAWKGPTAYVAMIDRDASTIMSLRADRSLETKCHLQCSPESWLAMPMTRAFVLPDFVLGGPAPGTA